jgi:hypothetical protein
MSLIIPCCCNITETGCVFPPFYPNPRKGNGETGTCCRYYPTGNCCVYDIFGYKIECSEGITLAGCNAKIIPGDTTTKFIPYEGNFLRPAKVLGCDTRTERPRGFKCDRVEGVKYKCIDGFDQPTIRDVCCDASIGVKSPIVGDSCTNPNNVTKHIFWISYDGEESYTNAGGFTGIGHVIENEINGNTPPIFRGGGAGGNGLGCNIIDGIYTETWKNRLDNIGTVSFNGGPTGFPKYGAYALTTPTDHDTYDGIVTILQQYVDNRNTQYNAYSTEIRGIGIDIKAQWKLNTISWLWYNFSTSKYQFDPPCVSWISTLDRTFKGKYGEAYSSPVTFTRSPTPGISGDCDQGCCCNNIQPIVPGAIGCQCKDTCGSISTTTNLNFATTGKCVPNTAPNQPITSNFNFVSNINNNIPIVVDVNKNLGSNLGGSIITITGNNLINTNNVIIGGNSALDIVVNSDTSITFTTPPGNTGIVEIELISETSSAKLTNKFAYTDTRQDLFGYLFWITKGIVNTTEFNNNNNDCLVNSTQTIISTDELFSWSDEPDSFKFDDEWNNILQIVSDLNSNPDSILKGEFYTARNMKYLQFDGSLNKTYKSPCVEIVWNWSMTNPGCVNTLNDKSGWECVPCLNDCCSDVCPVDSENIEILSKCGSFSKTQYIGQADCSDAISITTSSNNNKLLAITPIDPIDPTDSTTTISKSQFSTCECIDNITECECVNQKPGWMDWFRTSEGLIKNRISESEVWSWSSGLSGATRGTAGQTEPCAACKFSCCVKGPDGVNLFKLDNLTKCQCDAFTTATAIDIKGKYNGNVATFGDWDCYKIHPRTGLPTSLPEGITFCPCEIPPPPVCEGPTYDVIWFVDTAFALIEGSSFYARPDGLAGSDSSSIFTPIGINPTFGQVSLPIDPIERLNIENIIAEGIIRYESQSSVVTEGGPIIWSDENGETIIGQYTKKITSVYKREEIGRVTIPFCGAVVNAGTFSYTFPATFSKWEVNDECCSGVKPPPLDNHCSGFIPRRTTQSDTSGSETYSFPQTTEIFIGSGGANIDPACGCPPLIGNNDVGTTTFATNCFIFTQTGGCYLSFDWATGVTIRTEPIDERIGC